MTSPPPTESPVPLVLNVDDDEAARYVKTRILRRAGFEVVEVGDGESALRVAPERMPDVVLLDVRLPDISGIEVCRRLKADPVTQELLVLQTSAALVSTEDRARGLRGGADHYLAQPFGADELVASVQALLRIRAAEASTRALAKHARATARELAAQNAWLELLAEATADLLAATDVDSMLGRLFARIGPALHLDAYFHYAIDGEQLRLVSHRGLDAEQAQAASRLTFGQTVCGQAALDRRAVAVRDVQASDEPRLAFIRSCGLDAYASTPLYAKDRLVGTLGFGRRDARPFGEDELRMLRTLCGSVAVARERILTEERLVEQAARMRELDIRKDEFLAMLAHELRNPLAPLTNALALLARRESFSEPGHRALDMADRQVKQLRRLVDDLLDVGRITRGKIVLRPESIALTDALQGAVDAVQSRTDGRRQTVVLDWPAAAVRLVADPVRLAQVLENLLNNASKFTPEGGTIRVAGMLLHDMLEVRIIDDGIGIDPSEIEAIFELFEQGDHGSDRAQGGLGIGLALARQLVELHGGTLDARSEGRGRGATFVVRLPRVGIATSAPWDASA